MEWRPAGTEQAGRPAGRQASGKGPNKQAGQQASRPAGRLYARESDQEVPRVPTFILRAVYSTKKEKTLSLTRLRPPLRGVGGHHLYLSLIHI